MNSFSPALYLLGVLLAAGIIMVSGINIYNSASSSINDSLSTMTTQEINAFNSMFENYRGKNTGSQVSALCSQLIANSKTYEDEANRVPDVVCDKINQDNKSAHAVYTGNDLDEYVNEVATIKNYIENKHTYNVTFSYNADGMIKEVNIDYDVSDTNSYDYDSDSSNDSKTNNSSSNSSLSSMEAQLILAFNSQFESYKGNNTGSQILALCSQLIANSNTYKDEPDKVPSLSFDKVSSTYDESVHIEYSSENDYQNYTDKISSVKTNIENKHVYNVTFSYDSGTGLIDEITINY